jgi:alpha-mannosidase
MPGGWAEFAVRPQYILAKAAKGGETIELYVEVAVNHLFGLGSVPDPTRLSQVGILRQAEIAVFDRDAWDLLWDYKVIADMAEHLPANTARGGQALYAANKMINLIDLDDRETWKAAREVAAEYFSAAKNRRRAD